MKPKIVSVKAATKIKKVTIRLDSKVRKELMLRLIQDGYNMNSKSKWVSESIEKLMSKKNWETVLLSEAIVSTDTKDVFTLPIDLFETLNNQIKRISVEKPFLNPTQSSIVRAAIQRRFIGIDF